MRFGAATAALCLYFTVVLTSPTGTAKLKGGEYLGSDITPQQGGTPKGEYAIKLFRGYGCSTEPAVSTEYHSTLPPYGCINIPYDNMIGGIAVNSIAYQGDNKHNAYWRLRAWFDKDCKGSTPKDLPLTPGKWTCQFYGRWDTSYRNFTSISVEVA